MYQIMSSSGVEKYCFFCTILVIILALCFSLVVYGWYLYNVAALSKIPRAHWSTPLSRLYILWLRYNKREMQTLWRLHQELGPVLRIAPSELSIARHDGIKTVYGGGFNKPGYYDFYQYYDKQNTFVSFSRHDHAMRRKRVTAVYAKSALFSSLQLKTVNQNILQDKLMPWLTEAANSQKQCDALRFCYALCLDYCNNFIWGIASGSDFLNDPEGLEKWLDAYEGRYCHQGFWIQELPGLSRVLKFFGYDVLPKSHYKDREYIESWLLKLCDQAEVYHELSQQGRLLDIGDEPAVFSRTKLGIAEDSPHLSPEDRRLEIASELFDHSSGAREVLGMVLAYTLYYIARDSNAQDTLRIELQSLGKGLVDLPSPAELDALPYLTAVLKESFRLRPNSTPLPRITPSDRTVEVGGYSGIPPNTRIAAFQWFVHRDQKLWYQANDWMPERWLSEKDVKGSTGMERKLWAFASGPRGCLGQNLTYYMCRYILYAIFTSYKVTVADQSPIGRHAPGSLEDRLPLSFQPLCDRPSYMKTEHA